MKFKIKCILLLTIVFCSNSKAQKQGQFNKIAFSYIEASSDQSIGERTKGLEMEYYFNLKKRYGISISLEGSSLSKIPAVFSYGDERSINSTQIKNFEILFKENKSISQIIFASHFYLNLIKKQKHLLYFSNGVGYNIQRINYQNYFQYNFTLNSNEIITKNTELSYLIKNTETLVYLTAVGYDYSLPKKFTVGINIRGQLPVIRDKHFFTTGGGYDELIRIGLKLGKEF